MKKILLETHDLCIGYHSRVNRPPVVSGLNLQLRSGQLTCLIGPNGIGKSTLLRTLAGLQKPLGGDILIDGRPISQLHSEELARKVSIVLTDSSHPGDLRVAQVVELGRLPYTNWLGTLSKVDHQIVRQSLELVNAISLTGRSFSELSDGERQKVMIARALAQEPTVMILDEPTAFLDWPNRVDLLVKLKEIASETEKAILISSHDLELVLQVADELWLMNTQKMILTGKCGELIKSGDLERTFIGQHGRFRITSGGIRIL